MNKPPQDRAIKSPEVTRPALVPRPVAVIKPQPKPEIKKP